MLRWHFTYCVFHANSAFDRSFLMESVKTILVERKTKEDIAILAADARSKCAAFKLATLSKRLCRVSWPVV